MVVLWGLQFEMSEVPLYTRCWCPPPLAHSTSWLMVRGDRERVCVRAREREREGGREDERESVDSAEAKDRPGLSAQPRPCPPRLAGDNAILQAWSRLAWAATRGGSSTFFKIQNVHNYFKRVVTATSHPLFGRGRDHSPIHFIGYVIKPLSPEATWSVGPTAPLSPAASGRGTTTWVTGVPRS